MFFWQTHCMKLQAGTSSVLYSNVCVGDAVPVVLVVAS